MELEALVENMGELDDSYRDSIVKTKPSVGGQTKSGSRVFRDDCPSPSLGSFN